MTIGLVLIQSPGSERTRPFIPTNNTGVYASVITFGKFQDVPLINFFPILVVEAGVLHENAVGRKNVSSHIVPSNTDSDTDLV
jgi:hypothetical protein